MMIHYTPKTCKFAGNNFPTTDEATFAKMIANKEPVYEVTMNDKKAKYYFDIDLYAEDTGTEFDQGLADTIADKGKQYIIEGLAQISDVKPNIAVATSHGLNADGKEKYSVRYWVSNMMDTKKNIEGFVKQLNQYVLSKSDGQESIYEWIDPRSAKELKAKPHKKLFDEGVYSSERKMRCVNTSKEREIRPLIMKEGTIEQTIITGCFDEDVVDIKCVLRPSSPNSVVPAVATHSNTSTEKMEADVYYKYLNCIGNKMCDRGMYNDTITILQILKNENLDIKYVKYWIQRFAYPDSKKYTYAIDYYKTYIKYTPANVEKRLTIKSLKYFAKLHNPILYSTYFTDDYDFMIKKKYPTLASLPATNAVAEAEFANLYYEFKKDRIHYKNDNIYLYYNDEWNITTDKGRMVKNDMYEFYIIYFKVWLDYINDYEKKNIENQETCAEAKKLRNVLGECKIQYSKNQALSNTYQMLLNKLSCVKCSIIFDVGTDNYYNIHFKNGVYELKRGFRSRLETDYVTKYLDYDYLPLTDISKDIQNDVLGFFQKVQPDKEQRDFTLGYLAYCLTGDTTKQIFKMNIGHTASNGKSTELKIHSKCFKNYTQKLDNKVLLLNFEKRHKHLIDLITQPIRLVYFEEMPKGKKLDVEFIKDFVDGENISCEIMFGTKSEINIQAKIMSVSNHDFQVDTDAGILRRGRVQKYESKFISKDDGELDAENHIYEKIEGFENKFDDVLYKNAYFHLLLNYIDKLVVPKINKDEFKKTAEDNDDILTDILNGFTITKNHDDFIGRNEIDNLCGTSKEKFKEYKSKLQGMGCIWESQKKYKETEGEKSKWKAGCFTGLRIKEITEI
jgi:phage/plasmid-associated DNA primase